MRFCDRIRHVSACLFVLFLSITFMSVAHAAECVLGTSGCSPEFTIETSSISSFAFKMSAQGTFYVDWGDGNVQTITRTNTTETEYSHTYSSKAKRTIGFRGQATAYNTALNTSTVSFNANYNITGISGSLGAVFSTLSDGTQPNFRYTFMECLGLKGPIPKDLFKGITGQPRNRMFMAMFRGCMALDGEIPSGLFSGLKGEAVPFLFREMFYNCSKLTGSIPAGLFSGITGTAQQQMFYWTFRGCSGLTGTIPEDLFSGISGAPESSMFAQTFRGCTGLSGFVPKKLFASFSNANYAAGPMTDIFLDSGIVTTCPSGYEKYTTGFEVDWSGRVSCVPFTPVFKITTTNLSAGTTFSFLLSPKGTFYVDWGDGNVQTITKTDTTNTSYSHTYSVGGTYVIGMKGTATAYNTGSTVATIRFSNDDLTVSGCKYIAGISGSLGAMFGTLSGTAQPSFRYTFNGCTELATTIPSTLFSGISGQPRVAMFMGTFQGNSNLAGPIPSGLFGNISGNVVSNLFRDMIMDCKSLGGSIPGNLFSKFTGAPQIQVFKGTFHGCKSLTGSIPGDLFSGISGAPAEAMFQNTFGDCEKLTGTIPATLFAKISGAPAPNMFNSTFYNCVGLTGYVPENLFAGITSTNYTSGPMADVFLNTGLETQCPATQYFPGSPFDVDWDGKVFCKSCPSGTLSAVGSVGVDSCYTARKLHVNSDFMLLMNDVPSTSPALVVEIDGKKHYGLLSDTERSINENSDVKLNVRYNGIKYWAYEPTAR